MDARGRTPSAAERDRPGRDRAGGRAPQPDPGLGRLWSHDEAARWLHISPWTLHHLVTSGEGPPVYLIGRRARRYLPGEVLAWVRERQVAAVPGATTSWIGPPDATSGSTDTDATPGISKRNEDTGGDGDER